MDCCELALHNANLARHNANLALYIAIGGFSVIALFAFMFFGYSLKLDGRTANLEKKNGHEQHQINSINSCLASSNQQIAELKNQIQTLKASWKPTNPIPPTPPAPPLSRQFPPKPATPNNQASLLAELKAKQKAGKLKPSEFKN